MQRFGHKDDAGRGARRLPELRMLPRAVYGRSESLPAGSWTLPHRHRWAQLSYASLGVLRVEVEGRTLVAPRERAIFVPAGVEHVVRTPERAEMRSLYLRPRAMPWKTARTVEVTPLLRELLREAAQLPPEYDRRGRDGRLVSLLLDELLRAREVRFSLPLPYDARVTGIVEALQRSPADRRDRAAWARSAALTERTLGRIFRRETGLSFAQWRKLLRLLSALPALEQGESVTRVALESGYDSPSSFIAAFQRVFGRTPGAMF